MEESQSPEIGALHWFLFDPNEKGENVICRNPLRSGLFIGSKDWEPKAKLEE